MEEKPRGFRRDAWRLAAASLGTIVISMHQRCTSGALWDDARPCVSTYTSHLRCVGVAAGMCAYVAWLRTQTKAKFSHSVTSFRSKLLHTSQ